MTTIAFVHNRFPAGGAERITLDIAQYLSASSSYRVLVYSSHIDGTSAEKYSELLTVRKLPLQVIQSQRSAQVEKYIVEDSVDILVQVGKSLPDIEGIRSRTGCKTIIACHGEAFWQRYIIMNRRRKNWLLWNLINRFRYSDGSLAMRKAKERTMADYRRNDAYIVLCQDYKREIETALGIDPQHSRILVIENSEKPVRNPQQKKEKMILFCGRLENWSKRVDRLLRIWAMIQDEKMMEDWHLEILGDGEDRQMLEVLARELELRRLEFKGYNRDVASFYRRASVVCLTSQTEGWPLALTEGIAHGCIGVAFGCTAGIREVLAPSGECGFTVTPFDEREYADTLLKIAAMSEEEAGKIRENGISKRLKYIPEVVCRKWQTLFDLLKSGGFRV